MKIKISHKRANRTQELKLKRVGARSAAVLLAGLSVGGLGLGIYANQQKNTSATGSMSELSNLVKINPAYEQYVQDVENGRGSEYELIPNKYIPADDNRESAPITRGVGATNLPAKYNLIEEGYGTTVKDQGADGICWAFAITSASESYLKKHHIADVEFSAKQMDYLYAEGTPHANYISSTFGNTYYTRKIGGGYNFAPASTYFLTGLTLVDESGFFAKMQRNDPTLQRYNSWFDYAGWRRMGLLLGLDEGNPYNVAMNYNEVSNVKSDYIITQYTDYVLENNTDLKKIKENIYNNGGVVIGTVAPGTENCYDENTKTIIDRGTSICGETSGHAMLMVGWDDNYTYTDPTDNSTKTGAFILQNSWGTSDLFERNGVDFDYLADSGIFDRSNFTEEQIAALNDAIANYDPPETAYFGYSSKTYADGSADIGLIQEIQANDYEKIYNTTMTAEQGFSGASVGENIGEAIYTYNTGSKKEIIDSIAAAFYLPMQTSLKLDLSIDSGNGYKEIGSVEMDSFSFATQKILKLQTPIKVSGTFKIKFKLSMNGTEMRIGSGDVKFFAISAFTKKDDGSQDDTPDTPTDTGKVTWIQGKNHIIGEEEDLIVKIDYPLNTFLSIKLDGEALDEENYELASGSTIITIPYAYLDTLEEGKHELEVAFADDKTVNLEFTIAAEELPVPQTNTPGASAPYTGMNTRSKGDALVVISLSLPAIFGFGLAGYYVKKNKKHISFDKK